MSQKIQPYQISIQKTRQSVQFTQNATQLIGKILNVNSQLLTLRNYLPGVNSESKLLNGPNLQSKLVAVFRQVSQKDINGDNYAAYGYFGLFLIDLTNPNLNFSTLIFKVLPDQQKARDITVHPDTKKITLFYQKKIQYYKMKNQNNKYDIVLTGSTNYPKQMLISDVNYLPSGDIIIGLSIDSISNKFQPFKLIIKNNRFVFGRSIQNLCINFNSIHYLSKWNLAINKNLEDIAVIVGNFDKACIMNITDMTISTKNIVPKQNEQITPLFNQKQQKVLDQPFLMASSIGVLNSTGKGNFIFYKPFSNTAQQFLANQSGIFYKNTFTFQPGQNQQNEGIAKCIDIPDINGFACIKNKIEKIYISKIDQTKNVLHHLLTVNNLKNTVINQSIPVKDKLTIQDIFYNSDTSEICYIYDLKLSCFKINTKCKPNSLLTPLNKCKQICQQSDKNSFWNPISMSCQSGKNVQCLSNKTSFNPYYGQCTLNCSQIPLTTPNSQYFNNQKCICNSPYSWFNDLKICRYNCSEVSQIDPTADYTKLQLNQCKCAHGFRYIKILNSFDQQRGFCKAFCDNGKPIQVKSGVPICQCPKDYKWDYKTFSCKSDTAIIKSQAFPRWGILLIVCMILFLLTAIGICIYRKCKSKKKQTQQVPPSSDRKSTTHKGSQIQLKRAQSESIKACSVCNNGYVNVNCMGPCGHFYHFYCIKQRLDAQIYQCPECNKTFPNGLADMKLVQKQQQVFSISEN